MQKGSLPVWVLDCGSTPAVQRLLTRGGTGVSAEGTHGVASFVILPQFCILRTLALVRFAMYVQYDHSSRATWPHCKHHSFIIIITLLQHHNLVQHTLPAGHTLANKPGPDCHGSQTRTVVTT
jgi:hypothetical protein